MLAISRCLKMGFTANSPSSWSKFVKDKLPRQRWSWKITDAWKRRCCLVRCSPHVRVKWWLRQFPTCFCNASPLICHHTLAEDKCQLSIIFSWNLVYQTGLMAWVLIFKSCHQNAVKYTFFLAIVVEQVYFVWGKITFSIARPPVLTNKQGKLKLQTS